MVNAPPPRFALPIVDGDGRATRWFRDLIEGLWRRSGGVDDALAAAHALAAAAAPATRELVASGGLQGGGTLAGNVGLALYRAIGPLAGLPAGLEGDLAYATDGRKAGEGAGAGTGLIIWWSAGAWIAIDTGAPAAS